MTKSNVDHLPERVPPISLRYGQTIWLLTELGLRGPVSKSTFHEYLKALRKLGIPFGREKFRTAHRRRLAYYSYFDLMELALTLSLRVYHVVPDSIIKGIARHRDSLHRLFRRAYEQRDGGTEEPLIVGRRSAEPVVLRGLFLDLNIRFAGGHLVRFGPLELLCPLEAVRRFSESLVSARPLAPINLSFLSGRVVMLALNAPPNQRALKSHAGDPASHPRPSRRKFEKGEDAIFHARRARQSPAGLRRHRDE